MPWDPMRDLRTWQTRLERLTEPRADAWTPPIDVYETEDRYVVAAEVPGLTREEIELAVEPSRLTLRGQRADAPGAREAVVHFHQVERGHGAFSRSFEFAGEIDVPAVTADLTNGVLTIVLPKVPPTPARRIEVR